MAPRPDRPKLRSQPGPPAYALSPISIVLPRSGLAGSVARSKLIPQLERAHTFGVTTFDLTESSDLASSALLLATAFPEATEGFVAIVPPARSRQGPAAALRTQGSNAEDAGPFAVVREELLRTRQILGPAWGLVVETAPAAAGPTLEVQARVLDRLREEGIVLDSILRCRGTAEILSALKTRPVPLLSGSFSLLDQRILELVRADGTARSFRWIARDVFAGGRLDASAFAESLGTLPAGRPVPSLRELTAEYEPVLSLRFLTERTGRTLPQAALDFVLRWPWVATASIPLPRPERIEEFLEYESAPPLTERDVARLSGARTGDPGPPPTRAT